MDYETEIRYPTKPFSAVSNLKPLLNPYYSHSQGRFQEYNTPESFRQGIESKDMDSKLIKALAPAGNRGFTEGGVVFIPIHNTGKVRK